MKKKLVVTSISQRENYLKLIISLSMDKSCEKEFKKFFDELGIEYSSFEEIAESFRNGIHFYFKKGVYDLEMIRFSEKMVFMIVRSDNKSFQKKFLETLVKNSEYSGQNPEIEKMWKGKSRKS